MMNPDGFFIVNMGTQIIQANVVNQANASLKNARVYVESVSDMGIVLTPAVKLIGDVPSGSSFPVRFEASFYNATPGTALISFVIEGDGFAFKRVIKKIFVTRVDYHKPSKTYSVVMPQGTMRINIHKAIMGPSDLCKRKGEKEPFIALPTELTYTWIPTPPYAGTHGPLPYEDPWWKIALGILAALILAGALLWDYFSDGQLDGGVVSVGGTFDETEPSVSCCSSVSTSAKTEDTYLSWLYSAAGAVATLAIASDGPDLHYRGQEATPPARNELTLSETVHLKISYPVPPNLGRNYPIEGEWKYTRKTTGNSYHFSAKDKRKNLHFLKSYEVKAPTIHDRRKPLKVCARFQKPDGSYYRGGELHVNALLVSQYDVNRHFILSDDGMGQDDKANDGWYCGGYTFRRDEKYVEPENQDLPGDWYLFVFAQDVNTVTEGTPSVDAARTIGGLILTPQLVLNFDSPCELNHDATIHVV
jgi:hypothetical protein